ncbi:MAG: glycosyltransferase family 2 protein [Phocaeicola sp.]
MKVAVVILNWNGSKMLRQFLPSVVECSSQEGVAIYVADNASTDDSYQLVTSSFPTVQWVQLSENHGFAEGYNQAFQQIQATYLVLLNSDVEVTSGWLLPLIDYLDNHPEAAACQPKILSQESKQTFEHAGAAGGYMDWYGYPFCRGRIFGSVERDEGQYDTIASLFWASGAALCIRSADYHAAGGLDKAFFAHMEEIDLCWRLRSRGREIVCIPQSVVYHVGGGTLPKENPRKVFLNFRNNLLMLYKNLPDREWRRISIIRLFLDWLALFVFLLKGEFSNAYAVIRARRAFRKMRGSFSLVREENLAKIKLSIIPERKHFSLVWRYYVKRVHFFSSLD